jgi:phenylpyruvate tautomerase PptA (4-oxalocrotonate tautomerase family)
MSPPIVISPPYERGFPEVVVIVILHKLALFQKRQTWDSLRRFRTDCRMPFVQVHSSRVVSSETRRALGLALAKAYGENMQISHRIVNVGFVRYEEGDLSRYDASGDAAQEMTVVTCDVRAGRTAAMHEHLGRAITRVCAAQLGVPEARIAVYINEHAASQIYRDGGRAPDWSPAEGATR